jgi:hypothetical protein
MPNWIVRNGWKLWIELGVNFGKLAGSNVGIASYSHCPYVQRKKLWTNEIAQIDAFELFLRIPLKYELGLTHCMQKTCKLQGTFHKNLKFL